jgi:histidinol-phosphate aminotransferase
MSQFLSQKHAGLVPYVPGEQPQDQTYNKLNTNESPFPPTEHVLQAAAREAARANLYSDPDCRALKKAAAKLYGLEPENVLPVNGSDEILYFSLLAFGDAERPFAFPDISYGFYPIYADFLHVPAHVIPLKDDFTVDYREYCALHENVLLANPNAPTGTALPAWQLERIVQTNPDRVVVIDEAYVDFGAESVVPLIKNYKNLVVTQTFSKSRSLAGARLGFGLAQKELIQDLAAIKNSVNPYNVNRMTQAMGIAACEDNDVFMDRCKTIRDLRNKTAKDLVQLGFTVLPSSANYLFAKASWMGGEELYKELKSRGILVRHFTNPRISDYCRVTVGSAGQMEALLKTIGEIRQEKGR